VNAAVICDAYRGFANMSIAVDALVVVVGGSGSEEDSDCNVKGDTAAHCFPLSDAEVDMVVGMWLFTP